MLVRQIFCSIVIVIVVVFVAVPWYDTKVLATCKQHFSEKR
jgi:hypothetical protein